MRGERRRRCEADQHADVPARLRAFQDIGDDERVDADAVMLGGSAREPGAMLDGERQCTDWK